MKKYRENERRLGAESLRKKSRLTLDACNSGNAPSDSEDKMQILQQNSSFKN
jgi:hypothetical protein